MDGGGEEQGQVRFGPELATRPDIRSNSGIARKYSGAATGINLVILKFKLLFITKMYI